MERNNKTADLALVIAFGAMILLTVIISWYRLVVMENFRYVTDEDSTPESLDLSTY